jgi:hypothetical protein
MAQPIPASTLLHSFRRHLEAENRSQRTLASYLQSVQQAEAFLATRGKRLEEASRADLEAFLGDLLRGRAPATAATRYKVLRILYRWLEEGLPVGMPMASCPQCVLPAGAICLLVALLTAAAAVVAPVGTGGRIGVLGLRLPVWLWARRVERPPQRRSEPV